MPPNLPVCIAETGARFVDFAPFVACVDALGRVSFQARTVDGRSGVFRGAGGTVEALLPADADHHVESHPAPAGTGGVYVYARRADGRQGVYRVDGVSVEVVAETGGPAPSGGRWGSVGPLGPTTAGEHLAFRATLGSGEAGVFRAGPDGVVEIARTGRVHAAFDGLPVARADGSVVFRAEAPDGSAGVWVGAGGVARRWVGTGGDLTALGRFPAADADGGVVIVATTRDGGSAVLRARDDGGRGPGGAAVEVLLRSGGGFARFRGALVDHAGRVVFYAEPPGGRLGVYRGPDPTHDQVVGLGDLRFGAPVTDLALNPVSLNGSGQIAIRLALADGRQRIVRDDPLATPPAEG